MSVIVKEIEIDINIDEFSDEGFDLEQSMLESKEIYKRLVSENRWVKGEFEDDEWAITHEHYQENTHSFEFSEFNLARFNTHLPIEFKEMVKCWIVQLIDKYAVQHAKTYLTIILRVFETTKGFRRNEKDTLLKYIKEKEPSNKAIIINTVCNFFDYTDLEIAEDYVPSLMELKEKLPASTMNTRQLPPSRYVLSFAYYLEKHFQKILNEPQSEEVKELLLVYPLVIWWKLTNLIPMRATEFSLLKRDCIFIKNKKHYIKLRRIKQKKNRNRVQVPDNLLIDEEMYNLIENYVALTNQYGRTDTLISYRSIMFVKDSELINKDTNNFGRKRLYRLIKWFYKTMETTYGCNISDEYQLAPNDTRHLAFVSLMMQGYSPIEIARLGGHTTIRAQYHYSVHKEYWVDCEVFKLMQKVKSSNTSKGQVGVIPEEVQLKAYSEAGTFKRKMKVGHCKDEQQRCETKLCYFCSHWGITPEEFIEKKEQIKSDIVAMKDNISELTSLIHNLNRQLLGDELNRRNPDLLTKIKTKTNAVQSDLYKLAILSSKIGGGEVFDGEKISWT